MVLSLRAKTVQIGQFIGARSDFIPEPICKRLVLLQDKVRPACDTFLIAALQLSNCRALCLVEYHRWFWRMSAYRLRSCTRISHNAPTYVQVPPMTQAQTRAVIEGELGGTALEQAFSWIDLTEPIGSATIAQVLCQATSGN